MILRQREINTRKVISLAFEANKEISFQDDFIIINKEGLTKVMSSRCTHLGCRINQSADDQLLCPCHGSTFDLNGNATKGPAIGSLKEMKFEIDSSGNKITVIT